MRLVVQLLGTPQFQLDQATITAGRRAVVALLGYLVVRHTEHPEYRHSRESLATLFWTDYDLGKALANLHHTPWEVTQFIGDGWVIAEHETIYLNARAGLDLDVAQFQSLLRQASQQSDPALRVPLLVDACMLYRDDFMSGFSLKDGANFNEWVSTKSEALRNDFAAVLGTIVEDYEALDGALAAIPYAQRLIALDPINEASHRKLMQLYALTDQQTAAIRQYQALEKLLRKELTVDPQTETRELYKKIRREELKGTTVTRISLPGRAVVKHNLPVPLTTFVGREKERDEVSELVRHNRLVTLIGTGGIGKTRLAKQVGAHLLKDFPEGVWFAPLEALMDQDLVPQTIASSLSIGEVPNQAMDETIVNSLRSKSLLIILDNCEHLLDACAQVTEKLLKNCSNVKILATSREILRLEGEASYLVPSLASPRRDDLPTLQDAANYEAVQLFAERARLVISRFKVTDENVGTIVRICNRLDGIPLAIELAAAHLDMFKVQEILKQLNHSFDLLASNTRSVLPRHQTMRTSIDWGWNLLTEAERTFMMWLSVFIGGWTLQAPQFMGIENSMELSSALLRKSFIIANQQMEDETRYGFHEVIRAYAHEKLLQAGEEKVIRDRHLGYFLQMAWQLEPALREVDQQAWLERLLVERDNLRSAMEWAARTDVDAGLYLAVRLRELWEKSGAREDIRWMLLI